MAIISGDQSNQQGGTNLNAGMNTGNQQTQQTPSVGAVTASGQSVSGQGGATSSSSAPKQTGTGFTNFGSYQQANQKAGQRLDNLLQNNTNQQGSQAESNLSGTAGNIQSAIDSQNQQIKSGIQNVQNAVTQAGQGNFGAFSQFLNPNSTVTPQGGATTGATANTQNTSSNPANQTLSTQYQNLASGTTNATQLNTQLSNLMSQGATNQANLQNNAALINSGSGINQLLSGLLGQKGNYGQGAQALDNSLITGNAQNYTNLINNANQQSQQYARNLANQNTALTTGITGMQTNATDAQKQLQQLLAASANSSATNPNATGTSGMDLLNSALYNQVQSANSQEAAAQKQIQNEFATGQFDAGTAAALGIQNGALLGSVLSNPSQYYSLNQQQNTAANVINNPELQAYSAMQQLLGQSGNSAYQGVGTQQMGYTLDSNKFDQNLSNYYNQLINNPSINASASGDGSWHQGTFNTNINLAGILGSANLQNLSNSVKNNQFSALTNPLGNLMANTTFSENNVAGYSGNASDNGLNTGVGGADVQNLGWSALNGGGNLASTYQNALSQYNALGLNNVAQINNSLPTNLNNLLSNS